jgi:hypothetical protein
MKSLKIHGLTLYGFFCSSRKSESYPGSLEYGNCNKNGHIGICFCRLNLVTKLNFVRESIYTSAVSSIRQ